MSVVPTPSSAPKTSVKHRHALVLRVISYFALASLVLSALIAIAIVVWTFQQQTQAFEDQLRDIETGYLDSLAISLWNFDDEQLQTQIQAILNLDAISYVKLSDFSQLQIERGDRPSAQQLKHLAITHQSTTIGELIIGFDREAVLAAAKRMALISVLSQLFSLLLLASLLGGVVHQLITRRIKSMADEVQQRIQYNDHRPLSVRPSHQLDEIDTLVLAFNSLSAQTNHELEQRILAQQALENINQELEQRVSERTEHLQSTVNELNQTLNELHATQSKLIEAEKLSSLGGMVAGIAHEINTPLGLCITLHSFIQDHQKALKQQFEQGNIRKQDLAEFITMMDESLSILDKNLQRSAQLIKSFKQVSEDQTGEHNRDLVLHQYLTEILATLSPKLKKTDHQVIIECADDIRMYTNAGAISQVMTNLIMNSLLHGFEHKPQGTIRIRAEQHNDDVVVHYHDNGCGLSAEAQQKIFDPFYTTKRGYGGTGLGMHVVYTIVRQRLQGHIEIVPCEQGTAFKITLRKYLDE
ncbi:MAG: hypothetical protein IBX52_11380 [Bacterioplanes sp.]|nr:hypothetical protein [Bacterioplanes sp.]